MRRAGPGRFCLKVRELLDTHTKMGSVGAQRLEGWEEALGSGEELSAGESRVSEQELELERGGGRGPDGKTGDEGKAGRPG